MKGYAVGVALVVLGLFVVAFGDRRVGAKGGIVTRTFAMHSRNAKVLKWVFGILCLWFGVALLFGGGHL
jgi:hypothetical protein